MLPPERGPYALPLTLAYEPTWPSLPLASTTFTVLPSWRQYSLAFSMRRTRCAPALDNAVAEDPAISYTPLPTGTICDVEAQPARQMANTSVDINVRICSPPPFRSLPLGEIESNAGVKWRRSRPP